MYISLWTKKLFKRMWGPILIPLSVFYVCFEACLAYQDNSPEYWNYIQQVAQARVQHENGVYEQLKVRLVLKLNVEKSCEFERSNTTLELFEFLRNDWFYFLKSYGHSGFW